MKVIPLFENGYHFPQHLLIFQMEHSFNHYTMIWLLRPIITLDGFQSVCVSPRRGSQNWMHYLKCGLIMQNASVLQLLATRFQVIYRGRKHSEEGVASWSYSWLLNFHKTKMSAFTDRTLLNKISWALFLLELIFWVEKISCMSIHTRVYFWHWSSILITCAVFFLSLTWLSNVTIFIVHHSLKGSWVVSGCQTLCWPLMTPRTRRW